MQQPPPYTGNKEISHNDILLILLHKLNLLLINRLIFVSLYYGIFTNRWKKFNFSTMVLGFPRLRQRDKRGWVTWNVFIKVTVYRYNKKFSKFSPEPHLQWCGSAYVVLRSADADPCSASASIRIRILWLKIANVTYLTLRNFPTNFTEEILGHNSQPNQHLE